MNLMHVNFQILLKKYYSIDLVLLLSVIYIGKLEDGSVFERKGSEDDPYAFVCIEGT